MYRKTMGTLAVLAALCVLAAGCSLGGGDDWAGPAADSGSTDPGGPVTLVDKGATWKYLDNGSDQGTAWSAVDFDDAAWKSGAAILGFSDDAVTVVSYGPDGQDKYPTTYFRYAFEIKKPSACQSLELEILRDDGAIVYLNGKEVFRTNMPFGTVSNTTRASEVVGGDAESEYFQTTVDPACLVKGKNVLAVELHQANARSSDLAFDLELVGSAKKKVN